MENLKISIPMKQRLYNVAKHCVVFLILSLLILNTAFAQQFVTKVNGWNAYVHLPDDYSATSKNYPAIIFVPGIGEVGTNASLLLVNGPSHFVDQGNTMQFVVNGVLEKPIIISIQPP